MVRNVWLGGEGKDWKEKRLAEEKKAEEEGRGFGSVIWGQVREVWGLEKKKEEIEEKEGKE